VDMQELAAKSRPASVPIYEVLHQSAMGRKEKLEAKKAAATEDELKVSRTCSHPCLPPTFETSLLCCRTCADRERIFVLPPFQAYRIQIQGLREPLMEKDR
jgi:hypothetical protein